ncbi:MAG: putative signal peptide protein, partial [Noviherbaspirillum sp.]|nr:putative signal peptide protein [Noviherbaspirillum sp.]
GELAYRLTTNLSLFGRGQYMTNQFTGEIPFAYNTFTAGRFDKRYGIVTVGLAADF